MPFILIKGNFRPGAGLPDGDSVRFKARDNKHWKKLEGRPVELGTGAETNGTVQLRLEGIDAIEKAATKPLSVEAKENMFKLIGFDEVSSPEPSGFILARMTDDKSRRPICFIFAGKAPQADGADVHLDAALLRKSVNWKQMRDGFAYPLYYNTLFASLRREFDNALKQAKAAKRGYWPKDRTLKGVSISSKAELALIAPVWPKLWRRLQEHFRANSSLKGFKEALEKKNERIDIMDIMEERGLQDIVAVKGKTVRLTVAPELIRVRGKAGKRVK